MSKILKTIEITDDAVLDSKEGKKTILKVIDKSENKEDRMKTADGVEVFPTPADPVLNEATNTILDQNAKDYNVLDLTKEELADEEEVKETLDKVDIFKVLNSVDADLSDTYGGDYGDINILFSRSSKDSIRESALIEFSTFKKNSYVLGLNILEAEDNKVKFIAKSSYGHDIFSQDCNPSKITNTVTKFLEAIYLRDSFATILKESVDADRWGEIISDVNEHVKGVSEDKDAIKYSYSNDNSKPLEVTVSKGTDDKAFEAVRKYVQETYGSEVSIEDINDSSFLLK